jgi:hypothetical protein
MAVLMEAGLAPLTGETAASASPMFVGHAVAVTDLALTQSLVRLLSADLASSSVTIRQAGFDIQLCVAMERRTKQLIEHCFAKRQARRVDEPICLRPC